MSEVRVVAHFENKIRYAYNFFTVNDIPFKEIRNFTLDTAEGSALWIGINEKYGDVVVYNDCEFNAIFHELGHGVHEVSRASGNCEGDIGEDFAESVRWLLEKSTGNDSDWLKYYDAKPINFFILEAIEYKKGNWEKSLSLFKDLLKFVKNKREGRKKLYKDVVEEWIKFKGE